MIVKVNNFICSNVYFVIDSYIEDDSLYISLEDKERGLIGEITICLSNPYLKENENYIDTRNCPWLPDFLKKNNFAEPTGEYQVYNFHLYPLYRFNMEKIREESDALIEIQDVSVEFSLENGYESGKINGNIFKNGHADMSLKNTYELKKLYEQTYNNCLYYKKENKEKYLLNEIGVLRGIAYCLGETEEDFPLDNEFMEMIALQGELLKS